MGRLIRPRPTAWDAREVELCAENALWEEQDRLNVALALETDAQRQEEILARLDSTYREIAEHGWHHDWERRSYALPDAAFAVPEVPEHLRFPRVVCEPLAESTEQDEEEIELELELH